MKQTHAFKFLIFTLLLLTKSVYSQQSSIQPRLFWMSNLMYEHYTNYRTMIKMDIPASLGNK